MSTLDAFSVSDTTEADASGRSTKFRQVMRLLPSTVAEGFPLMLSASRAGTSSLLHIVYTHMKGAVALSCCVPII